MNKFTVVALLATLVLASLAIAQRGDGSGQRRSGLQRGSGGGFAGGGQRGGMMMRGGGGMAQSEVFLLARPDVQTDIKLTAEQKTKLEALQTEQAEAMRARFEGMRGNRGGGDGGGGRNFDMNSIREEMEKAQKEAEDKVKKVLSKEQWKRLGEIKVHMMGPRAAMDPELQKTLGIKASQKLEINKLNEALNTANMAIFARMRESGIDREALRVELQNNDKVLGQEIEKILTADQKKKLNEMKGKPFKQDMNYRPERGGFELRRGGAGGGRTRGGGTGGGTGGG